MLSTCQTELILYTVIFTVVFLSIQDYIRDNVAENEEEVFEMISNIHAIFIVFMILISFWIAGFDFKKSTPYGFSIILSFMGGYFLSDLISINKWWKNTKTGVPFLIHHLTFLLFLPFMIHCNKLRWVVLFMLLYEISTPFVNLRRSMHRKYGKNSTEHIYSAYAMYFVFFLVRIVTIPYIAGWVMNSSSELPEKYRYMIYVVPVYMLLNIYWFFLMTQNAWKHANQSEINDDY